VRQGGAISFCPEERFISTLQTAPNRSATASPLWRPPQSSAKLPNWLKSAPFIAMHLGCLAALFTGVNATAIVLCVVMYFVRMFGITAGYHRYFAHRSFKTSRVGQFLLACLGATSMQKGPLWWASHHRRHHRYSDTPDDPHSPLVTSFWWAHLGWIMSDDYTDTPIHEIPDYNRFPELRLLERFHWVPGVILAAVCLWIGGWTGFVWGFVISTVILYHCTFFINSLSHLIGRRRYATTDESRNNLVLALLTLGEGWHNNHHHYMSSANQGFFWWEIDISYYVIRLLSFVGLTWDVRRPGKKALEFRRIGEQTTPDPVGVGDEMQRQRTPE
jgi:stearoyl-CoA desaturase (delta-9 desaturase)